MSTPPQETIANAIHTTLAPFEQEVESDMFARNPIELSLSESQLALLASHLPSQHPKAVIWTQSLALHTTICTWNTFFQQNSEWIHVHSTLSEQERVGDVSTTLSRALHTLLYPSTHDPHLVISDRTLSMPLPDQAAYANMCIRITQGESMTMSRLISRLIEAGYVRNQTTLESPGMRVQGEHIRIAHPVLEGEMHITFSGNTIERIVHHSNRRGNIVQSFVIPPVSFPKDTMTFHDLLASRLVFVPHHIRTHSSAYKITIDTSTPTHTFPIQDAREDQEDDRDRALYILLENHERIRSYLQNTQHPNYTLCHNPLGTQPIHLRASAWTLRSEASIFPPDQTPSPIQYERALELIAKLEKGKPAVHTDHGIGIYEGMETRTVHNGESEYLIIRYAQGDALFVPALFAYKVSPYVGQEHPVIHRLGGSAWKSAKKKAKKDAEQLARELLAISKKRTHAHRSPYVIANDIEHTLDSKADFTLTPDQKQAWKDVREDLTSTIPMDRLIVGDVGFGKTEIAIRAARHVMENGKQVAVLAPTTLLVQQHFDTFKERLSDIQEDIHLLSRFVPSRTQQDVRQKIQNGQARIVVGTHALLSRHVNWDNLGLVIIDEEQRFGVKHKEHFKRIRSSVDVLCLSATPIPRTLSMALSNLRSLSVIATAPKGRKDIHTLVTKINDNVLTKALEREMARSGQVYVVAPKIRHLAAIQEHLLSLVPNARISIAHAQLPDKTLSTIIHDFDEGNIDILVSSSIVENGLDLAKANTMIVWHAPHFGLSELYQLRGRVGRRKRQGYAYFLYNQEELTPMQRGRLAALTEAGKLGSGWDIARKDLEMRGCGNLLGAEQSGSVHAVGLQTYLDMVHDASEGTPEDTDVQITLPLCAIIPAQYMPDPSERGMWYRRIARTTSHDQLSSYAQDMANTFGPIPQETSNLFLLVHLQQACAKAGISAITNKEITPNDEDPYHRLIIHAKDIKRALRYLHDLGNIVVRNDAITWDVDAINENLLQSVLDHLNRDI